MTRHCFVLRSPETGEIVHAAPDGLDGYDGWELLGQADRWPRDYEAWDADAQAFVLDRAREADDRAGRAHVEAMHTIKVVEAALIASGHALAHGVLAEEAAALGIDPAELARSVLAKAAEARGREIARRRIKAVAKEE